MCFMAQANQLVPTEKSATIIPIKALVKLPTFAESMHEWIKATKKDLEHSISMTVENPPKWKTSTFYEGLAHAMNFKDWNTAKAEIRRVTEASQDLNDELLNLASSICNGFHTLLENYELENFDQLFPRAAWWDSEATRSNDNDDEIQGAFIDPQYEMEEFEDLKEDMTPAERKAWKKEFKEAELARSQKIFTLEEKKAFLEEWRENDSNQRLEAWTCYGTSDFITPSGEQTGKLNQYSAWVSSTRNRLGVALRFEKAYDARSMEAHKPADGLFENAFMDAIPANLSELIHAISEAKLSTLTRGYDHFLPVEDSPYFGFVLFHISLILKTDADWLLGNCEFVDDMNIRIDGNYDPED